MKDAFGVERGDISKANFAGMAGPKSLIPTSANLARSYAHGLRRATAKQGRKVKQGVSIPEAKAAGKAKKAERMEFLRRTPGASSPKDQIALYGQTLRNPNKRKLP